MKDCFAVLIVFTLLALLATQADSQTIPQPFFTQASATSSTAPVPMDLSATKAITVSFWMYWPSYANDNALALEYGAAPYGFASVAGGWMVDPDSSQPSTLGAGIFEAGMLGDQGYNQVQFARPAPGTHYYAFVFDVTQPAGNQVIPYIDGVSVEYVKQTNSANTAAFAPATLYFMSRLGNQLVGKGTLSNLAIYAMALNSAQVQAIYAAGTISSRPAPVVAPVAAPVSGLTADHTLAGAGIVITGSTDSLDVAIDQSVVMVRVSAPATSSDACVANSYAYDAMYFYLCTAPNTWMRMVLSHW